jgi:ABC-type polysaccharide/polyol phosphate export permease
VSDAPIYDSATRPPKVIEEALDAYEYRDLIWAFTKRDIVTRYKRSVLGVLWTMLNPLGTMLIMVVVFYQLFHVSTPKYPLYVLTGLVAWGFFSQSTAAAPATLLWSGPLIQRVYVPRTLFAFTAVGAGLVNMLLSLIPLVLVMLVLAVPFTSALLMVPVAILLLAAFALGLGLLLSTWVVSFPDVLDIYQIALTAWLYLSAVFYPYDIIPAQYRWLFFNLNPMYHLILVFREPIYYGTWPSLAHVGTAAAVAIGTLVVGWVAFARKADELAYRL